MSDPVSGLSRLRTVPIDETAVPDSLLDMVLRASGAKAGKAPPPGAGQSFAPGDGEAFNPAVVYDPTKQRFGNLPYESYSGMSEGGLPKYTDAEIKMDKGDVVRPLSDFSARSFGGGVPGGKFHGKVVEAIGPSGQRLVAKAEHFWKGGKTGDVEAVNTTSDLSPSADKSTDWLRRHYSPREQLIDALKSFPAGGAEGTSNLLGIPRSLSDTVANMAGRPTGLEGVLPTEDENLLAIRQMTGIPLYESRTTAGKLARNAGYFTPWAASTVLRGLGSLFSGRPAAAMRTAREAAGEIGFPMLMSQ